MGLDVNTKNDASRRKEERVLAAAESCFVQYGFQKTTMGDIAAAAEISRPALYLMYNSKESVFRGVVHKIFAAMLAEIRSGMDGYAGPAEQLRFAFEVWTVRPFEIVQHSPHAADLLENSRRLSADAWSQGAAEFESLLATVLSNGVTRSERRRTGLSVAQVAHVLASAVEGFKESAASVPELQAMIKDLIDLVLLGLVAQTDPQVSGR